MSKVAEFLRTAKARFDRILVGEVPKKKFKIVMGNGACDLDSAACTLAISVLRSSMAEDSMDYVYPVFNLDRENMVLKTEVVHFLNKMNLSLDDLIYRADIEEELFVAQSRCFLEIILVDHHYDLFLNQSVVEIFDHHKLIDPIGPNTKVVFKPVGSCASIIMSYISTNLDFIRLIFSEYKEIADMCYGAILLDTVNFHEEVLRFTSEDVQMIEFIELNFNINLQEKLESRKKFHDELRAARNDVSKFSLRQLLQKDFKQVNSVPVCGLPILVQEFLRIYPDAEEALEEIAGARVPQVVLMGMSLVDGVVKKDVGFYLSSKPPFMDRTLPTPKKLAEEVPKLKEPDFQLTPLELPISGFKATTLFDMGNIKLTRKHLLPAIWDILK